MSNSLEERDAYVTEFSRVNTHLEQGQQEPEFNGQAPSFVSYADIERYGSLGKAMVAIRAEQAL